MEAIADMRHSCVSSELCVTNGQTECTYDCWTEGWDKGFVTPARCAGGGERDRTGGVGGDCKEWGQEEGKDTIMCDVPLLLCLGL
jgi:hypothetical protein